MLFDSSSIETNQILKFLNSNPDFKYEHFLDEFGLEEEKDPSDFYTRPKEVRLFSL